jgi:hypothetical protein
MRRLLRNFIIGGELRHLRSTAPGVLDDGVHFVADDDQHADALDGGLLDNRARVASRK